ncbi:MAG: hypothetical protein OQK13_04535, partial [Gammaproteobacteria bacterium]|nr:hypothetical protein [Gammaproteobacteria bacterium]
KDLIQNTMLALHDGIGLNRVVFAVPTNRNQLKGRSVIGSDNNPIFNQFSIDVLPGSLFEKIMSKPTTLWLDDHNREKFWPHIPEDFQRKICNSSFFISSIHQNDKPYALIYADRHTVQCRLDERSYKLFKRITTEMMKCLNRPRD